MKKALGQYMTPEWLSQRIAVEAGSCDLVVDFAVGDGQLLKAVQELNKNKLEVYGYDLDATLLRQADLQLKNARLFEMDGLANVFPEVSSTCKLIVVGNPPYLSLTNKHEIKWSSIAFPDLQRQSGLDRAEVQFLSKSLVFARQSAGKVIIVLPVSFADGDKYKAIRASLMSNYHVLKSIEVQAGAFSNTEARAVILVIDTVNTVQEKVTEIGLIDNLTHQYQVTYSGSLMSGDRLDARYYLNQFSSTANQVLNDLDVTITRGLFSRKEAERRSIPVIHTSDLTSLKDIGGAIPKVVSIPQQEDYITVKEGDILLARTGKRVCWEPVIVSSGEAPITDHVFRIRAPKEVREIVVNSFRHPDFRSWLQSTCKGVCATVLTKRDLLEMPLFALEA